MKRLIAIVIALTAVFSALSGCAPRETYEIALVTDVGNIDDASFNQGAFEGIQAFAAGSGVTYNYYRPFEDSDEARIETIKKAIKNGAKTVVCPGSMFASAVEVTQKDFPNVNFLVLDVSEVDMAPSANTALITFEEEQSGYFAGYAAVMDGYTQLGFLGGMAVPAVVRYGSGFVQGADAAAREMGVANKVSVRYWYSGSFTANDEIRARMDDWFAAGAQIVFACGGEIYTSAVAAAEAADGLVIGVDKDQSGESELFVTSAIKSLEPSVEKVLKDLYLNGGVWPDNYAGRETKLGAADHCTGLAAGASAWRFQSFTVEEYEALYEKIRSGEVTVSSAIDEKPEVEIDVNYQD